MTGFNPALPVYPFTDPTTGAPLAFGTVETYLDGTSTPEPTFADAALTTPNPTTISLGASGEAVMYFDDSKEYKLISKRQNGTIARTFEDVRSAGIPAVDAVDSLRADLADVTNVNKNSALMTYLQPQTGGIERKVRDRFLNVVYSDEFIAAGTESNATVGMQAFLNAAAEVGLGILLPGDYYCETLVIKGGTHLLGVSRKTCRIIAKSTLPASSVLLWNETTSGAMNTYYDDDILIENVTFDGNANTGRSTSLVALIKTQGAKLLNCRITNNRYQGIIIAGCKNTRMIDCELDRCGKIEVTVEGGSAIWMGASGDGSIAYDTYLLRPYIHDCEWSAIYPNAQQVVIKDMLLVNIKESAIFANNTVYDLKIEGGEINGTTKKYISATGIETGASVCTITGVTIRETADAAIVVTDGQNVTITGCTTLNAGRDPASFPARCHIAVVSLSASPNNPRWVTITGNTCSDVSLPVCTSAIACNGGGSGSPIENSLIADNNLSGTAWTTGKAIDINYAYWAQSCFHRNNAGHTDCDPKSIQFLTPASPGNVSYTGFNFRPRALRIHAAVPSTGTARISSSQVSPTASLCNFLSTDGSVAASGTSSNAINIVTAAGVNQIVATLGSFDADGCTLNYTTTDAQAYITIEALP